jgi:hypothetical protein
MNVTNRRTHLDHPNCVPHPLKDIEATNLIEMQKMELLAEAFAKLSLVQLERALLPLMYEHSRTYVPGFGLTAITTPAKKTVYPL